ncbi:hypothetical protein HMPREF1624_04847 [Sporothrix schenckii ATCC 58251]|uniref:Uncharacterized protein n=1 Tax=Sporothrix schenckii (strain ATCC 58251 / de Perez 2211183) TaxID=1391915 RepID=U7PTJ1_SPOS1|nr:hypothetical protein HMPREF1624_04847 [Sporothrix schenckii ATCC 58251]
MPGRQAHGRPLLADPNKKRKSGKKTGGNGGAGGRSGGGPSSTRSSGGAPRTRQGGRVDVMALAEQQIGESRTKGVRVRDLEIERDQTKRRRDDDGDDGDDDDDDEGGGGAAKRRRPNNSRNDDDDGGADSDGSSNDIHSDSSGNEWREGVGSDDDDSEIDSDEAFGDSDDDEIFDAFAFRGSSSKQNKNKKSKSKQTADEFDGFDEDDEEDDEDVGDDGADLGDEAIDLAAALDIVSSDEDDEAAASSSKKDKTRKKKRQQAGDSDLSASDDTSDVSGLSGSGSDGDDGSGSDELSSTESSEYDSDEEDEEDGEDEDASLGKSDALQSIASAYAAGQNGDSDEDNSDGDDAARAANPYQFNAQLGSKDRSLKKSIKAAVGASSDKTLEVPLLPMQQDRQLRIAAADKAHETLDRWTETVKQNRRAEHLTFEVAGALATSGLDTANLLPINQKSAQTDLEKTILSIMEESGLGPQAQAEERAQQKQIERQKADEEASMLSPDALKAIIGQKRRARELQSREQARAKRIKKIKSKAYRRVHRRERQRAEEALDASDAEHDEGDEDHDSEAERDAAHRRRALERMGARHRDSRWAKRAKNTNRAAWDDEFRTGLVDMARQDEELRRRVDGAGVGGGRVGKAGEADEESDSDSFDEESDEEAFKLRTKQKLAAAGGMDDEAEPKGLMGIAFMKKAELARKKANDEAVAEIMRDLDRGDDSDENMIGFDVDGEDGDNDAADKAVGRRSYGPVAGQTGRVANANTGPNRQERRKQAAAERETAAAAATAADVSNTFPARTSSAPGDAGSWTVVVKTSSNKDKKSKKTGTDADATPGLTADGRLVMSAVVDDVLAQNTVAENRSTAKETAAAKKAAQKAAAAAAGRASQANDGVDESETSSSGSDSDDADDTRGAANRSKYFRFRAENELLLRKALGEDGAAAEFAAEKVRQAAEEAAAWEEEQARVGGKKNKNSAPMPGWGSWIGDGVSKRAVKRDQRAVANKDGKDGRNGKNKAEMVVRRDAKMDKVIISERRVHKNEKYLASQLPHEFETRSQYERSLRLPVGPEWSTTFAFQDATKPRVLQKQGVVLPMAKPQL